MFDRKTDEFIGFCGFRSEQGVPELICMLHERFWGQGITGEAATACIDYGYQSLGFTTIKAYTRPAHFRARRVLEKLDAEFVGYTNFHGVCGASYILVQTSTDF
jgi:RimJ/RimL family protein N-acetyltransferase